MAIKAASEALGCSENSLSLWKKKYRSERPVEESEMLEELKKLCKENHRLKQEREILKKAMGYFVKDQ